MSSSVKDEFLDIQDVEYTPQFEDISRPNQSTEFASRGDEMLLRSLLQNFEMEFLWPFLKAADITYRSLRYLSVDDINAAIRSIGYRAEFREKLFAWRSNKFTPEYKSTNISTAEKLTELTAETLPIIISRAQKRPGSPLTPDLESDMEQSLHNELQQAPQHSSTIALRDNALRSQLNLNSILDQSYSGISMKEFYKKNGFLDRKHRDDIIQMIVDYVTVNSIKLHCSDFGRITDEISSIFPTEVEARDYYYIQRRARRNPMGRLYSKYYNTIKRLRTNQALEDTAQAFDNSTSAEANGEASSPVPPSDDPSQNAIKSFLRCEGIDWDDVNTMWSKTCAARQFDIRNSSTKDILVQWPKYLMPKAVDLFSIDFKWKYPNKSQFSQEKWTEFETKIYSYYHINIKEEVCKGLFALCKAKPPKDVKDYLLTVLLNAIMPPTARFRDSVGTNRRKVAIVDAVEWFAIRVQTLDQLPQRKNDLLQKYCTTDDLAPYIVVVGESSVDIREIYVNLHTAFYKMPDFLSAIDVCLKIFRVLAIPYPQAIIYPWTFIQKYFYDIQLPEDSKCPSLSSLLTYMKF